MLTETIILLMLNAVSSISMPSPAPHIIIIIADDLGWNDVSFHGSNEIPTPNIDALAYNGIILNNHYVPAICTPSRAALLTGKYPIHTGMQHSVLFEPEPRGLPLTEKLLSQYLQQAGYKTHAVGKWHLGFYKQVYTPTFRGFDSHFGYWNGLQDYYNHDVVSFIEGYRGFDMRRNMTVAIDTRNKYSTDLFTDEAVNLINQHNINEPLFLYMAHLAVHSGNEDKPFQAPDEEIVKFSHIEDPERRTYAAMVKKLDDSVGEVVAALQHRDMLKNSIILFMADNGAPTMGLHYNSGSNYPLRGIKDSAWEGGIRSVAAIWSPLIKNSKRVSNQLMHVTDWLPTFLSAAGISSDQLGPIDGINFWPALNNRRKNPRTEILINIDNIVGYSAIRSGDLKYINGSTETGDSWYGSSGELTDPNASVNYSSRNILECKVSRAINNLIMKIKNSSDENMHFQAKENKTLDCIHVLTASKIRKLRDKATIRCNKTKSEEIKCNPLQAPCLFNIKNDPCEMINLASSMPQKVKELKEKLQEFQSNIIPPSNVPNDKNGNPALWNGIWVSWQDPNPAGL